MSSSALHKQQVHSQISQHDERASKHREANAVLPQRHSVKAKRAEDRRARDLDVEAVLVVHEGKVADLVYDEALEGVVEDGELRTR